MPGDLPPLPPSLSEVEVLTVRHWTDRLFSFTVTRDPALRFESGQFVMLGMWVEGRPLLRAYSIASSPYEDVVEFFSIKVPDGPLTSRLQSVRPGDRLIMGRKPTGTLLASNLMPGRRLYMLSTGTGLAPFLSLSKDPEVLSRFEAVTLTHGCRYAADLAYAEWLTVGLPADEFLAELVRGRFRYYPHVTREVNFPHARGRITDLIRSGQVELDLGLPELSPEEDRVMICGSEMMLAETKSLLEERGFVEGSSNSPGQYVIEKSFVQK